MTKPEFNRLKLGDVVAVNFSNSRKVATVVAKLDRRALVRAPGKKGPLERWASYRSITLTTEPSSDAATV